MEKTNFKSDARKLSPKELKAKKLKAKKSTTYWEKTYSHLYVIFSKVADELKETKESSTFWETRFNALKKQSADFRLQIAFRLSEIKTELEDAQTASELITKQAITSIETTLDCGCRPEIDICSKCCPEDCAICHPNEYVGD